MGNCCFHDDIQTEDEDFEYSAQRTQTTYNQNEERANRNLEERSQDTEQNLATVYTPKKITVDQDILSRLLTACSLTSTREISEINPVYELKRLNENSQEFQQVKNLFFKTNKKIFKLHSIEKVYNPFLMLQYRLKQIEYTKKGVPYEEEIMFHGTKKSNIDSICEKNFNWRLRGFSRGYKFGQGISFSPIANYATHYGDATYNKVMLVVKVLIGNCCIGSNKMVIPPRGYDTSANEKKHVYVKYEDNAFYPVYVIHYGGIDTQKTDKTDDNPSNNLEQLGACSNDDVEPRTLSNVNIPNVPPNFRPGILPLMETPLLRPQHNHSSLNFKPRMNFPRVKPNVNLSNRRPSRPNFNRNLRNVQRRY